MVTLLAMAWVVVVVGAAVAGRPGRVRVPAGRVGQVTRSLSSSTGAARLAGQLDEAVARLLPRRWRDDPLRRGQVRVVVPALVAGLAVWPPAALPLGLAAWAVPLRRRRRDAAAVRASVVRELPDVIDLFSLAVTAGLNVHLAVEAVAGSHSGVVAAAFADARAMASRGIRLHIALALVTDRLGDPVRPLVAVLSATDLGPDQTGAQLAVAASDARLDRRRHGEAEARRIPVRLLFPLVLCVLPAFALLTVVPVIVGSLGSLSS